MPHQRILRKRAQTLPPTPPQARPVRRRRLNREPTLSSTTPGVGSPLSVRKPRGYDIQFASVFQETLALTPSQRRAKRTECEVGLAAVKAAIRKAEEDEEDNEDDDEEKL